MTEYFIFATPSIGKGVTKKSGDFRPFLVQRFLTSIICQMMSYNETSITKKFRFVMAISYEDIGGRNSLSHQLIYG